MPNAGVAVGLTELLPRRFHDQRVMQELRWLGASEEPRELQLPAGGFQQIDAANDMRHALGVVVHGGRKLIRPVPFAIADQRIAALLRRPLLPSTEPQVDKPLHGRLELHSKSEAGRVRESTIAARAGIAGVIV